MSAAHTPGPWEVSPAKTVEGTTMVTGGSRLSWGLVADVTDANDARLIAAAPDLLKALKHLVHWHDQLSKDDIAIAEIAIAKAEGRA